MCKITFLMKVYNGEAFVGETIESVLNQTEKNIKLYIRNNGSKDHSDEICKKYARMDSRITYLENKIGGYTEDGYLYCDRQFWPEFSSEYVSIVDHDDILEPNFAAIMYQTAKETGAQMTICGNSFFDYNSKIKLGDRLPPKAVIDSPQKLNDNFEALYGCLRTIWGKLYETSWYEEHYHILSDAPEDIGMSTDTYYILSYLKYCPCLATVDLPLYQYCVRRGSGFHAPIVKKDRIHDGDILFDTAKDCLEHYGIANSKNIYYLYAVHWGHMCDIMKVLSTSSKMSGLEKISYIQDILNNKLLQSYLKVFDKTIWNNLCKYLQVIIPDINQMEPSLWECHLVKLYYLYLHRDNKNEPLPYMLLLSAICDPKNTFSFGIELLKDNQWEIISPGERRFRSQSLQVQRFFVKSLPKLKEFISNGDPQKYIQLEDSLANSVENEDYEKAGDLLSQLNEKYPLDEYAFYYRIYLSDLIGDHAFAVKQAYAAKILWSDSKELTELCQFILSAPAPKKQWIPMKFEPEYLNIDISDYEDFSAFSSLILRYSFSSLLLYASALKLKTEQEGEEGKVYTISPDTAKMMTQTIGVGCFKTPFEGGATLYDSISDIKKHIRDYQHLYTILSDEISKNTLTNLLLYRFTGSTDYLRKCSFMDRQYYLPQLLPPQENAVFIDCGAYDGETVLEYVQVYGTGYKQIYAYEPAPENYLRVCDAVEKLPRVNVKNKGVADKEDILKFTSALPDAANRIHPSGDVEVQVTYLDKDIAEKVDFIKMDIEGMEQSALYGARNHISQDHPCLAICVYHLVEDLWKIPKLIEDMNPDQKFYLRYHLSGEIAEEIVFYACPDERL